MSNLTQNQFQTDKNYNKITKTDIQPDIHYRKNR